jgi:hypothetical protein
MAIKRMNYFKGEFLHAQDFKDEQQYHVDMLRSHNENLHTWGIADGLDITFIAGEKKITVTKGMAIDAEGKQIVLLEDKEIDLSASTETTLYVTVSYKETPTDPRDETGIKDNTRITEAPDIKHEKDKPSDPSVDLILAKVILNPDKTIKEIDKSERKNAGVVGGDLEVKSIAFSLPIATNQWPRIKGVDGGSPGIEITSKKTSFTGDLNVAGKVDGRDVSADGTKLDNHVGITSGNPHGTTHAMLSDKGVRTHAEIDAHIAAPNPHSGALSKAGDTMTGPLTINNNLIVNGNVGIGTANPQDKLDIAGGLRILTGSNPIRFTPAWSGFPDAATNQAEISNDIGTYKTLMIVGNKSAGLGRRVSVWDRLEINGTLVTTGNVGIGTTSPTHKFHVVAIDAVGLFESTGTQAYLRFSTNEGMDNRVEICNRPGGRLSLWTAGGGDVFNITKDGKVGIGTTNPQYKLHINGPLVVQQAHTIKIGVPSPATPSRYGNDGIRGEPNLWLDAANTVYIKPGFQTPSGFDIAERFKTNDRIKPGDVVVYDEKKEDVKFCKSENDKRVVGIASAEPAFILGGNKEEIPIALCGRVLCKVDADIAPIAAGDLLTTSPTEGHAQKVLDPVKSAGAIIGKALGSLARGKGEILVLVSLQ